MAEHFLESARRASDGSGPQAHEAAYQNLVHALELGLKAFVRAKGWTDDRCRREIRHDLVRACRAAEDAGLEPPSAETLRLLVILTPFYASHSIDDFVCGGSLGLDVSRSVSLTAALLERIREAVG